MKHLVQTAGGLEKLWGDTTATEQWSGDGQYDLLAGELKAAEADRDALRAENERLREALRFYANQDNWRNAGSAGGFDDDGVPAEWDEIPQSSACAENQGATARAALGETDALQTEPRLGYHDVDRFYADEADAAHDA